MAVISILRRLWPIFALDAAIYFAIVIGYSNNAGGLVRGVSEVLTYAMVAAIGYFSARFSGRLMSSLATGAIFWFVWKPFLFLLSGIPAVAMGSLDIDRVGLTALGALVALLLFSPVALGLCVAAGWIGKRWRPVQV